MPLLMAVGSSEVSIFKNEKKSLRLKHGVYVRADFLSGRHISSCPSRIRMFMSPDVKAVIIWSLTTSAWKRKEIKNMDGKSATVFEPNTELSVEKIPEIMTEITEEARKINSRVKVYLFLPPIQDMHDFNKKRIIRDWGSRYATYLIDDPIFSPERMQEHSITSYKMFESLLEQQYQWPDKNIIRGTDVLDFYYQKNAQKGELKATPHSRFLAKETSILNSPLLPDGLHPHRRFLESFMDKFGHLFKTQKLSVKQTNYGKNQIPPRVNLNRRPRPLASIPFNDGSDQMEHSFMLPSHSFLNDYNYNVPLEFSTEDQYNYPQDPSNFSYQKNPSRQEHSVSYAFTPQTAYPQNEPLPESSLSQPSCSYASTAQCNPEPSQSCNAESSLDPNVKIVLRTSLRWAMEQIHWTEMTEQQKHLTYLQLVKEFNEEKDASAILSSLSKEKML